MNTHAIPHCANRFLIALLTLAAASKLPAQDQGLAELAKVIGQRESGRFSVRIEHSEELAQPRLLQNWTNPTSGSYGSLHCWMANQRPVAITSVYMYADKPNEINAEFQSLCRETLSARRDGTIVWNPNSPGVKFTTIPDVVPVKTRAQQSWQMRQISRRFSVICRSYKDGSPQQLRLLPRPLITYGNDEPSLLGGLFTFAIGTDPAALLLIELIEKDHQPQWSFALARMCIDELEVKLDGRIIWMAAEHKHPFDRLKEPYSIKQHIPVVAGG